MSKHHTGVWVSAKDCRRVGGGLMIGALASGAFALAMSSAGQRAVIEHLVDTADAAMYEAKRAGGNQTRQAGGISQRIDRLTS
jgi:GGDEF domain-containing protein